MKFARFKFLQGIFARGSTTYFTASLFFTPRQRQAVTTLYAFVRVADDYVDHTPQMMLEFLAFVREWIRASRTGSSENRVIDAYVKLCQEYNIPTDYTRAFLLAMWSDLYKRHYANLRELELYMYGSAEVIGLMMLKILGVTSPQARISARLQGKAMQYINFLRDISEDLELGRVYLPKEFLEKAELPTLSLASATENPQAFRELLRSQLDQYDQWQAQAQEGYVYLPYRARVAVATAADMYSWTARKIFQDPQSVFSIKHKPPKWRIILQGFLNLGRMAVYGVRPS